MSVDTSLDFEFWKIVCILCACAVTIAVVYFAELLVYRHLGWVEFVQVKWKVFIMSLLCLWAATVGTMSCIIPELNDDCLSVLLYSSTLSLIISLYFIHRLIFLYKRKVLLGHRKVQFIIDHIKCFGVVIVSYFMSFFS